MEEPLHAVEVRDRSESPNTADQEAPARTNAFATLRDAIFIHRVPSFGNKIFYSLGLMSLTSLTILVVTGIALAFMGQAWWTDTSLGIYTRSVHAWAVQAFIVMLILHIIVVFVTSGYRAPRRMVWVFGAIIFVLTIFTTEFGYGLRGDFGAQYRAVSGADFWNGGYLGAWLNTLSYIQTYALHVAIIPILIFALFIGHYILEHAYGFARPYRKDIKYKMVAADHTKLFIRGGLLAALILAFGYFFPSPYVSQVTITESVKKDSALFAQTLMHEFDRTSDTATYSDSIDPYTFDTREVYVQTPYERYVGTNPDNAWTAFRSEGADKQQADIDEANAYVIATSTEAFASTTNPVIAMINALVPMAEGGEYESVVNQEKPMENDTYSLRLLMDMDVLEPRATEIGMNTANWGMARDVNGHLFGFFPGAWWFAPVGMANSTFNLMESETGDRDAAIMMMTFFLLFILFPYIPYLNRLPELFHLAPLIWRDKKLK